jgi:hypothetical protein
MSIPIARCALAFGCLATTAWPHETKVLLRVGDQVPGAGKITDIESIEVYAGGGWVALVHTDDPVAHTVLYEDGSPYAMSGAVLIFPTGASVATLNSPTAAHPWEPMYIARLSGGASAQAVINRFEAQLMTGEPATTYAYQLPAGSTWRRFDDIHSALQFNLGFLLRGSIDDPLAGGHGP